MSNLFPKTLSIKECRRCGAIWSNDRVALDVHDKVEIVKIKISYCPDCHEDFAAEMDRPTYRRAVPRNKK